MVARSGRLTSAFALACVLAVVLCSTAGAAPADIDRSFGAGGIVKIDGPGGGFPAEAGARMAIGPNDEVFVLVSSYQPCSPPFNCEIELSVHRYTPDGQLDSSFGTGFAPQLRVRQNAFDHYYDIAVGPDGKPVVAARDRLGGGLAVARLDQSGRLDSSFGDGGVAARPRTHTIEMAWRGAVVAVQPDGKVVVAAEGSREGDGSRLLVARYLTDGRFDPGFGDDGEVAVAVPTRSLPDKVLVTPSGALLVPAPRCCGGGPAALGEGFSIARVLPDGLPDPSWGIGGGVLFPTPGAHGAVEGSALSADGRLFISFEEERSSSATVGNVVKLRPDGGLAPRFGRSGRLRLYPRVGAIGVDDLALDSGHRLAGVGWNGRVGVFRLRANGTADRTFNGGVQIVLPFGGGHSGSTPYRLGIQSDGRMVVLGYEGYGSNAFALIRLWGGASRARCLGRRATIVGTRGRDELVGTPHRDVIAALGGKDKVRGLAGPDLICGGRGQDLLFGGPGMDRVLQNPVKRRRMRERPRRR